MCTLLAAQSTAGPVLGSNSDNPYLVGSRVLASTEGAYPLIGTEVTTHRAAEAVPWNSVMTRGLNARGVAFTYSHVPASKSESDGDRKLVDPQGTRDALGQAASAEDLVSSFQQQASRLNNGNYLIADGQGVVMVTINGRRSTRRTIESGQNIACTNSWFAGQEPDDDAWVKESFSKERLSQAAVVQSIPRLEVQEVRKALHSALAQNDDQENGNRQQARTVDAHGKDSGTISSEIIVPAEGTLWWCYGWPSGTSLGYESFIRDSWGEYLPFQVSKVDHTGLLTTEDGTITLYGTKVLAA
jgi:hypothetical protein